MTAIILTSPAGEETAKRIAYSIENSQIFSKHHIEGVTRIDSIPNLIKSGQYNKFVFVGAIGICLRYCNSIIEDKRRDPAIVNIDAMGRFAVSLLSGHIGGANNLCRKVALATGAQEVISTLSDNLGLWSLDTLASQNGWEVEVSGTTMNQAIATFVNGESCALIADNWDLGLEKMVATMPHNVTLIKRDEKSISDYELIIAVTAKIYNINKPIIYYRPKSLHLGFGCKKDCPVGDSVSIIKNLMVSNGYSPLSISSLSTIELKRDEQFTKQLTKEFPDAKLKIFNTKELENTQVPNPSKKVAQVTGIASVSEACAIEASGGGELVIEKERCSGSNNSIFTFAVAEQKEISNNGFIDIVGAGPGDPELISVRGKRLLEEADLILYAGSLVPEELTKYAKDGAVVKSSASMDLREQFELMHSFYYKGAKIVRLHTGDPCIYGAIQEQMAFFDQYNMEYKITPGISSFQAAAAALRSQFTIPEKVQTIILTRGEGRTPVPERERLSNLAKSGSTMCIFLSATIAQEVERELLEHYPATTPVAVCYKLTWPQERIFRGTLNQLSKIINDNKLTLTTMIVVGEAIDNRDGLSKLYDHHFKHLFRK